ncbi:CDC45-like protein [Mycena amicta]|nr:CDC45-like protein [Mycena amicta]
MLVAPDVDALCAARMLADLFKQDDVMYRIIPLIVATELRTLILLNMGAILDLPSDEWFGEFSTNILFGAGEAGERIVVWDDGAAAGLEEERKAWEALTYEPHPDSDDSDSEDDQPQEDDDDDEYEQTSGKRRSLGDGDRVAGKRPRVDREDRPRRMTRDEHEMYSERLEKYYMGGTWHGQSAAGTIYILATVLERVDNELLWLAIMGLTYQYTTARISRDYYDTLHAVYYDEVYRLNPQPPDGEEDALSPDDLTVRATDELRFTLFRHWTLYDAMLHSSYVASKLGIWKERGRKKLTGLLAKMGFSLQQTQEQYQLMDKDLKQTLVQKLTVIAPEYGLIELNYPSFRRCFGYRSQPLSAADAVEGISALLDVAGGIRLEVEVEGARRGGEWFGGGRLWEAPTNTRDNSRRRREERENIPPGGGGPKPKQIGQGDDVDPDGDTDSKELQWWVKNFWTAFDALNNIDSLRRALTLSMTVHRAIIDQGISIIDKQDIRTMRNHRVVVLTQGPHLALFSHPGVLSRLAFWLVDALRDRLPTASLSARTKRKSLPFVVACLNETTQSYMVVGVMASLDFDQVRKNEFGLAFLDAKERCNARTRHGSFDTSVLEINQEDLKIFLETLCEGREA